MPCPRRSASLFLILLFAGCEPLATGPEIAPVTGVVTYDDVPLYGATVTFIPKTEAVGYTPASGKTNDKGEYRLMVGNLDGAPVGASRVAISAPNPESPLVNDPRELRKPQTKEALRGASLIPLKYADVGTSGLSAAVSQGKENVCNFKLTSDGTEGNAP